MSSDCKTPFFVWFTGRTGSTFLCDLLASHPEIYCRKEDFSEIRVDEKSQPDSNADLVEFNGTRFVREIHAPGKVLHHPTTEQAVDYLFQIFAVEKQACGFKLKFPNQSAVYPEIMKELKGIEHIKVIELIRTNVIKQAVSLRNVSRIQELGGSRSSNLMQKVDLDPLVLDIPLTISHANYFLRTRQEFKQQLSSFKHVHSVTYEQLASATDKTLQHILEFLEVDSQLELSSRFQKATPDALRNAVANYDELVAAVKGTDLQQFVD